MSYSRRIRLALARLPTRYGILKSRLEVTRLTIEMPDLPPALDGLLIAHISDMHVGEGHWLPVHVDEAAAAIRREAPDVTINTGDFLQWDPNVDTVLQYVAPLVSSQTSTNTPALHVAILGNHDYYAGEASIQRLITGLHGLGVRVLTNDVAPVTRDGATLSLVGVTHHTSDFDAGVKCLLATPRPRVALIHEPDLMQYLPHASADLVLAGHTHGGQITMPGLAAVIAHRFGHTAYTEGFYHVNDMLVYVNRGLGTTGLPLRLGARPEVAFLRLKTP
ncbi:MAG: hypothetical protein NVS2B16_20120 [Chloroflexota bacterium]